MQIIHVRMTSVRASLYSYKMQKNINLYLLSCVILCLSIETDIHSHRNKPPWARISRKINFIIRANNSKNMLVIVGYEVRTPTIFKETKGNIHWKHNKCVKQQTWYRKIDIKRFFCWMSEGWKMSNMIERLWDIKTVMRCLKACLTSVKR